MKRHNFLMSLALTACFGVIGSGCSSNAGQAKDAANTDQPMAESVRTETIAYQEVARNAVYSANLQAYRSVHLATAIPGRIQKINVRAGDRFQEGQLLVEMDKTQLQQARLQLQNLETDYRRLDTLRRAGSISQQQYDQIRTQYDLARSNVAFLEENTRLLAPFHGSVAGKYFENGEMYSGAPNTAEGKAAILSLVQTNQLKANISIAESFYPLVKTGMEVQLQTEVYPGQNFWGVISALYPQIDAATRTFRVELSIPNADEKLRPGMFARASLEMGKDQALIVPALAVLKQAGTNERYVFLERNGLAHRVVVELGDRYDDQVEIISPEIKPGDQLITAGHARLISGARLSVQK